ncbi:class I SAM-dependent methyltransferase [Paenibacillus sp. SN-8-1]|uniref:class I SAM-dependent methyltransferase n=1 Tax=Paenibacillus sp. SN-8-1 TaxID=3435409 RepID=UPI003D9A42C8
MYKKIFARHLRKPDGFLGKIVALVMNRTNDEMNLFAIHQLQIQPSDTIMEIGFGNGKYFSHVLGQSSTGKLVGVDYSETMVNQVRKRYADYIQQNRLEVIQGSVSRIDYGDNTLDKIYTVNTLYFWPNPTSDIQEIYRVLKNEGLLVIAFKSREGMEKSKFAPHGFTLYSVEEVIEIVKSAGFRQVSPIHAPTKKTGIYCVTAVK